uniref:G-protein coupled receptors family 1 profile domain-containing protein n=1 Tax=Scophthalmus maximus TaxID=52904 RepID=A0A8D3CCX4_SCOMX
MKVTNMTNIKNFIIFGFAGLPPEFYGPVSFLLLLVFLAIRTLHKPTYLIFFHLAMTDISFGIVTLPKIIARYWWNDLISSFGTCFAQMYFVHSLGAIHSLIMLIMALDRFVATCFPFRYPVLITNKTISIACILCWAFTFMRMLGIVLHALTLPFCNLNIIMHCYCDHVSVTQLGCGENVVYVERVALANALVTLLVPLTFIISSYFSIIIIFITCLYYVPRCFVYLSSNLGFVFNSNARIIIAMMYSLIPAAVNPLIYCLKTQDIKKALTQRLRKWKVIVRPLCLIICSVSFRELLQ